MVEVNNKNNNNINDSNNKNENIPLKESISYRYQAMSDTIKDAELFSGRDTLTDTAKKSMETVRALGQDLTANAEDVKRDVQHSDRRNSASSNK